MRSALALASLATAALAAPYYPAHPKAQEVQNIHWVVETVVKTVYVHAKPTPHYNAKPQHHAKPHYAPAHPTPAPAAKPKPVASGNYGSGYMGIVNEWRAKMGLGSLGQSDMLQNNALKTVHDSNGQMVHELNPGSYGQVLAPGGPNDFEHVFVGGWLCERPSLFGAAGGSICGQYDSGWEHDGQTGHADILSSGSYSHIGCAMYMNIWCCDLA